MPYLYGIDSAQLAWNQVITAAELAQIDFHICRIGSNGYVDMGSSSWYNKPFTPDAYCHANIQATQAAGKPMGVYFFSYAWNAAGAIHEANLICDTLDTWGVSLELPIFLDWESTGRDPNTHIGYGSYEKYQDTFGQTIPTATLQTIFTSFYNRCQQRGRRAGMYFNGWFYNSLLSSSWINAQRSSGNYWWMAYWTGGSTPPYDCDVWQYLGEQYYIGNITTTYRVDQNYLINPNVISGGGGGSSNIPIWLKIYLAKRGDQNGKCTVLL